MRGAAPGREWSASSLLAHTRLSSCRDWRWQVRLTLEPSVTVLLTNIPSTNTEQNYQYRTNTDTDTDTITGTLTVILTL